MPRKVTDTPFFCGVAQRDLPIRQYHGKSPMFFAAAQVIGAVFTIDAAAAQALLPRSDWRPVMVFPGSALLGIAAFDYGYTDLGAYREVFAAIPIVTGRARLADPLRLARDLVRRRLTAHTVQLPVDSEAALFGGIDYYNVPKFMARIDFEVTGREATCAVTDLDDAKPVFALRIPRPRVGVTGRSPFLARQSLRNYSAREGRTIMAAFDLHMPARAITSPAGVRLKVGTGARSAMLAGLRPGRALFGFYGDGCEAILHAPHFPE